MGGHEENQETIYCGGGGKYGWLLIVWMKRRDVNTLGGHNDGFIRYNR
jgi:PHP family Zn ribbon phosphoesterase